MDTASMEAEIAKIQALVEKSDFKNDLDTEPYIRESLERIFKHDSETNCSASGSSREARGTVSSDEADEADITAENDSHVEPTEDEAGGEIVPETAESQDHSETSNPSITSSIDPHLNIRYLSTSLSWWAAFKAREKKLAPFGARDVHILNIPSYDGPGGGAVNTLVLKVIREEGGGEDILMEEVVAGWIWDPTRSWTGLVAKWARDCGADMADAWVRMLGE